MSRKPLYVFALVAVLALMVGAIVPTAAQDKVVVTWFVGLGTGTQPAQLDTQHKVVDDFNASQDAIDLQIVIPPTFETAADTLATLIAAGTPPDLVGPVGVGGSNRYEWLDIKPLIDKAGYDLSGFDPSLLDLYATLNGGYSAIPFLIYPSLTYYNTGLFDEAELNYPPTKVGEKYTMPDGSEVDWTYDTLAEVAKLLTVDSAGNDATSADFDPENIVQFGLNFQWARIRLMWTDFQPESAYYDWDTQKVSIPESWHTATKWIWDGIWKSHFIPTTTYAASEGFGNGGDNVFQSGHLGMAIVPLWYTCCLSESVGKFEWNFGVVPQSLDGETHVAMDADTFRIVKSSAHPEEAFTVLTYLLGDAGLELSQTYGGFPARADIQQPYIDARNETFAWGINWDVVKEAAAYATPSDQHHESNLPNWSKVYDREYTFQTLLFGDTGADMDVDKELDTLQADVQAIAEEKS